MSDKFTWMHSGQIGAPQMNGAAGSNGQMLQVLDDCLINGFNPQTVTIATKTATTVTLTFGVSHGYELSQIIEVSGATDAALNGRHRVTAKTATTVTIDAVGVAVTTGTIVTKVAHLGWESIFGSTDPLKRAYRSQNPQSSKTVLYLDMTLPAGHGYNATNPAKRAMVSICEDMTTLGVQINSYTDTTNNYATNVNGSLFWYQCRGLNKAAAVNDTQKRNWIIVGNDHYFWLISEWQTYRAYGGLLRDPYGFGDLLGLDGILSTNNCALICGSALPNDDGNGAAIAAVGTQVNGDPSNASNTVGYMTKKFDGTGSLQPLIFTTDGSGGTQTFSSGTNGATSNYPNPSTQSFIANPLYAMTAFGLRAQIPCLRSIPQNLNQNISLDFLQSDGLMLVATSRYSKSSSGSYTAFYAIDLEG